MTTAKLVHQIYHDKGGTSTETSDTGTDQLPAGVFDSAGTRIDPATSGKQDTANTTLAAIQAAAEIMDDWDESDRAKVNPIVGQAGVTGGAGAVDAGTQRVALATDANDVTIPEGSVTAATATATASGTTTVIAAPGAGNAIRLWWYHINADPDNSASNVVGLRWTTGGADFFKMSLSQYGGAIAHGYKAGRSYVQGGDNEALVINQSAAQTSYINVDYEVVAL